MARKLAVRLLIILFSGIAVSAGAQGSQLVDPMRPLHGTSGAVKPVEKGVKRPAKESLHLTAVLISEQRSVAVINGKSLQKGEKINGYRLVQIRPDHVELRGKAGKRTLRRSGTGLKKVTTKRAVKKGSKL